MSTMSIGQPQYEVESNSSSSAPQLLLKETQDNDFVRLWFQNNAVDKWAFNAKPKAGSFDADNLLESPIIFAYNGVQKFGISADGRVRINKAYRLPNVDGSAGQVLTTDGNGNASWQPSGSGGGSSVWQSVSNGINYSGGSVGIGTSNPDAKLDVAGAIKLGYEDPSNPKEGTIRWNTATKDFEGYDGNQWRSLMKCSVTGSSNAGIPDVDPMCCEEYHVASDIATNAGFFGRNVAIHGNYAVIAAGGFNGWTIYIFEYDGTNWSEVLSTKGSEPIVPNQNPRFGEGLAIYDDWIAVGAPGNQNGKVFMFKNDNGVWTETEIIQPDDLTMDADFGYAISIYDDYMAVSAPDYIGFNPGNGEDILNQGKVYLYQSINEEWVIIGEFDPIGTDNDTHFGTTLDITDQFMVIGSEVRSNFSTVSEGRVYIYQAINNIWSFNTELGADFEIGDGFGSSVAVDNNTLVIGARETDVNGISSAGAVYVYENNNSWTLENTIVSQSIDPFERFGSTIDVKGDYILIGKSMDVNGFDNAGGVEIHHYNSDWTYNRTIVDQLPEVFAQFGYNFGSSYRNIVATDGVNLLIGAQSADANGFSNSGKVLFGPVD